MSCKVIDIEEHGETNVLVKNASKVVANGTSHGKQLTCGPLDPGL